MKATLLGFAALCAIAVSAAPTVSNVTVSQDKSTRVVTVRYDLSEKAIVTVEIFKDGVPLVGGTPLAGDVSKPVSAGTGRWAQWRPRGMDDLPAGKLTARVRAWTESNPPDYMAIDLVGAEQRYYASTNELPYPVVSDYYRTVGMLFRRIPAKGVTFKMGSPSGEVGRQSNETLHEVTLTNDFYMAVFEVTQGQWINGITKEWYGNPDQGKGIYGTHMPSLSIESGYPDSWLRPVDNLSYKETMGNQQGMAPTKLYADAVGRCASTWIYNFAKSVKVSNVTLPTEAQWEFACRAGEDGATYAPDEATGDLAWYEGNADEAQPVGLKKPNAWGLYDMLGNVWENCLDHYQADLGADPVTAPYLQGTDNYKTCRGGAYDSSSDSVRSARRTALTKQSDWTMAGNQIPNLGFRIIIGIH